MTAAPRSDDPLGTAAADLAAVRGQTCLLLVAPTLTWPVVPALRRQLASVDDDAIDSCSRATGATCTPPTSRSARSAAASGALPFSSPFSSRALGPSWLSPPTSS
jgi:hypothetical protein